MTDERKKLKQELLNEIEACYRGLCRNKGNVEGDLGIVKYNLLCLLEAIVNYLEEDLYYDD